LLTGLVVGALDLGEDVVPGVRANADRVVDVALP
jgi:hypothetical protein